MYQIYYPYLNQQGEYKNIIYSGCVKNENIEFVDSFLDCDYIFFDFRHMKFNFENKDIILKNYLHKVIMIDYRDNAREIYQENFHLYFKRSVVDKRSLTFIKYPRVIHPISYAVKGHLLDYKAIPNVKFTERTIDISVLFSPLNRGELNNDSNDIVEPQGIRHNIARYIRDTFKDSKYTVHVGRVGDYKRGKGHDSVVDEYINVMLNSKIVVTCDPDHWEGDYRLFEALACGPLVFSNKMVTPIINSFEDGKHLIYYDRSKLDDNLKNQLIYFLENEEERLSIARKGYEHTMKYHKCSDRIDEIIRLLNG